MSDRRRIALFCGVVVLCLAGVGGYVAWTAIRGSSATAEVGSPAAIRAITAHRFLVYLTSATGEAPYDQVAIAPVSDPGKGVLVGMHCDRVAMTGSVGACVEHSPTVGLVYNVRFFDRSFHVRASATGVGLPSRARLSPSGRLGAVTSFIVGDSYAASGQFSTASAIFRPGSGHVVVPNLERLTTIRDGERFEPIDRNFWGVTFRDDRSFYATMGTGSDTYLVRGDLATRTLTVLHRNVECPALSPAGDRIGFKHRKPDGDWRFTVLDLRTGREVPLAETRSVDDQLAWLDNEDVMYSAGGAIMKVRADGSGTPTVLIAHGASPTVVA